MSVARRVTVSGRVQGVFYRAWTKEQADTLGVAGWIRNLPDGTVEAQAEGDENAVRQLVERMRHGPGGARIDDLSVDVADHEGCAGFGVRA